MPDKDEKEIQETPKRVDKKPKLSPEEIEPRYQEHLRRIGGR